MTLAHLVFAIATTAYIVLAIQFEEHDLVARARRGLQDYRRPVPMLLPLDAAARARDRRRAAAASSRTSGAALHGALIDSSQ